MGSVKENLIAGICAYPNCTCSPHSSCLPEVDVKRAYDAALEMLQGTSADLGPGELDRTVRAALAAYTLPVQRSIIRQSIARFLCEEVDDHGVGSYDICPANRVELYLNLAERLLFYVYRLPPEVDRAIASQEKGEGL